ncbi:MAG: hypothetical protein JWQ70_2347 [Aeromicrobium sp.]|nr:hypothetical protein [Aeromicrobium sp.]
MPELDLPYVDEHAVDVSEPRDVVWNAVEQYAHGLGFGRHNPIAMVLGTEPRGGFRVTESVSGERLALEGRHHFSRYRLVFELGPTTAGSIRLTAKTYAEFPGLRGRTYRALVIGSHGHAVLTSGMVRSIARRATKLAAEQGG